MSLLYISLLFEKKVIGAFLSSQRVGRTSPGTVFRLYTKDTFIDTMQRYEKPEILRKSLGSTILDLKGFGTYLLILTCSLLLVLKESVAGCSLIGGVSKALRETIDPPDIKAIMRDYEALVDARALFFGDGNTEMNLANLDKTTLSAFGRLAARLPMDIRFGIPYH